MKTHFKVALQGHFVLETIVEQKLELSFRFRYDLIRYFDVTLVTLCSAD
jgi:hypothetical protein